MLLIFASVLKKYFQTYVATSVLSGCCICFTHMLQLHMFHTHVASILSRCCIYFTHMLQVFYLDVAYVSHICCNSMFQMFHLCPTYVVSKCFTGHGE